MTILNLFISFLEAFFEFEVLGFSLYTYLIVFTAIIIIFKIINAFSGKD